MGVSNSKESASFYDDSSTWSDATKAVVQGQTRIIRLTLQ